MWLYDGGNSQDCFPGGSVVKNPPELQETWAWSLGGADPPEKEMIAHSSVLARKSHGQRSLMGHSPWGCKKKRRAGHDLATKQQPLIVTPSACMSSRSLIVTTSACMSSRSLIVTPSACMSSRSLIVTPSACMSSRSLIVTPSACMSSRSLVVTTSACMSSRSRSWGVSSSVLLWKHIVVCVVCELSLRSWRSLAWVTAYTETSDTDLGKALPAALGARPTHPVSADSTGGRGPSQPGMRLPHLRSSLWPWKPLSHIWMDRQQRKPNGLRNISVIYATNVFMFRDRIINLFYIFICKCGAAPVLL